MGLSINNAPPKNYAILTFVCISRGGGGGGGGGVKNTGFLKNLAYVLNEDLSS